MALARSDHSPQRFYSMSAQIRQERNAYYDMLEATQKGGLDITLWLEWFFACLDRALDGAESTLADVFRKAEFWKKHAGAAFNDRQRDMLNRLLDGFEGKLTTSRYAASEQTSPDTALRDITDLVEGDTVTEVLNYVQFGASQLLATFRRKVNSSPRITRDEANAFIADFVAGLEGYTYLEGEAAR